MEVSAGFSKNSTNIDELTAMLHDVGKLTEDFASYIKGKSSLRKGEIDHSYAGAKYLLEIAEKVGDASVNEVANLIARIIVSHHGLHDWIDANYEDYLQVRTSKSDRYEEIRLNITRFFNEEDIIKLLKCAAEELKNIKIKIYSICDKNNKGNKDKAVFAFYMGMLERFLESILVDADRIDTAKFMCGIVPQKFDLDEIWENMYKCINETCEEFRKRVTPISQWRMDISDRCDDYAKKERGICRLIVPTGGGKTLSSIRFAAKYCKEYKKEHIFYVAPFMSILEQNADVLRKAVGNADFILEHHSNIIAEIEDDKELQEYELKCERWETPVIATTMVQFLNSLFSGKMSSVRRFHRLANAVIIIDEVQSIPVNCVSLFNLAMNFLSKICGSTIILCSATQPTFDETKHKLLVDEEDSSMTGNYEEDFKKFKRTQLISDIRAEGYTFDQVADYAYEKYVENKNLLMIMNTKKAALEVFKRLKQKIDDIADTGKPELIYLSTLMCSKHRKDRLDFVRELLGCGKPVICVTTSLIEAGVDISFRCVIRSLAGAESIAQAAGRGNRNGEMEICPVYILNIREEKLGNLKQIKIGQEISGQLVRKFGSALFGVEAMELYFNRLYGEYANELEYNVVDLDNNTNLFELLSCNTNRARICKSKLTFCSQAFATAGKFFKVIDENTKDIIVPYDAEAEEIILQLNSNISIAEKVKLLRKAQKYVVNLYPNAFASLLENGQIYSLCQGEFWTLTKSAFSKDFGIDSDNVHQEVLVY